MKYLRITMPDQSEWELPALIIAQNRASYYAEKDTGKTDGDEFKKVYHEEMVYALDDNYEIIDWAADNMNWEDVVKHAHKIKDGIIDYQEGWVNGEKEIVEY